MLSIVFIDKEKNIYLNILKTKQKLEQEIIIKMINKIILLVIIVQNLY